MSVVSTEGLEKSYGAHAVLTDVTLQLAWGDRAALVGANGAGKTTLLEILAGRLSPDSGRVALARGARVGYLTQDPELPSGLSVHEAALEAFTELGAMEAELARLGERLEAGEGDAELLVTYGELQTRFEHAGGWDRTHVAEATLQGLGLPPALWEVPVPKLSGGQRVRLSLCRLLLSAPDLLLCDEPTNHLDEDGVRWLEARLARWQGALLLVSHDRLFLDRVATRILELDTGRVESYAGNYTDYARQRAERQSRAEGERARVLAEAQKLQAFVDRYRAGNLSRQAKSRQHRLDRLREAPPPAGPSGPANLHVHLEPRGATGREVLAVEDLCKSYGSLRLFGPWEATVRRGERVGIVGGNGVGKTTLLRILAGEETPDAGGVWWGHGVEVSWLRQDMAGLDDAATVLENVLEAQDEMGAGEARATLARYGFRGDTVFRRAGELSGGERNRLLLCLLALERGNVLLCDEPTNHLDIPGREALEEALSAFPGTLFLVSHDRYLLARLCTRIWWLHDGTVEDIPLGWEAYQLRRAESEAPPEQAAPPGRGREEKPRGQERARQQSERRRAVRQSELEERIAELEERLGELGKKLGEGGLYRDGADAAAAVRAYQAAKDELDGLYVDWERIAATPPEQDSTTAGRS